MHQDTNLLERHSSSGKIASPNQGQSSGKLVSPAQLPPVLAPDYSLELFLEFVAEYHPVGPTEIAIVGDLSRQAAASDIWGQGAEASIRQAAVALPNLFAGAQAAYDSNHADALLSAAAASESSQCTARQHLGHSRAFYRALQKLLELQARRKSLSGTAQCEPPTAFRSEADCEMYLAERFAKGVGSCPRCHGARGYYFAKRRTWECARCKLQVGLRSGTVMAGSQLALMAWFEAIRWLLWNPTISAQQLAAKLGIPRLATVRKIAAKIRAAMAHEQASEKLAGLDEHFARSHAACSHTALNHMPLSHALLNQASLSQAPLRANRSTPPATPQTTGVSITQANSH